MKVGFDIHGVIDLYPDIFRELGETLIEAGHSVHIITGQEWEKVKHKVDNFKVPYTHSFSIVDYHKAQGTKMWQDEKGTWWMDNEIWLRSKGDYIRRVGIDIHFDDSYEYAKWVPEYCTFVLVPKKCFERFVFLGEIA